MADYFLDTSAVAKRYVQETGTAWIRTLVAPATGHFIYLARISEVEVTSALARRRGQPGLSVAQAREALGLFRQDFAQDYRIAEITVPLLQKAALLADTHALRGYDAVQCRPWSGRRAPPSLDMLDVEVDSGLGLPLLERRPTVLSGQVRSLKPHVRERRTGSPGR